MKISRADKDIDESLNYYDFPRKHRHIYTNYPLKAIMKQIGRRTQVAGAFGTSNHRGNFDLTGHFDVYFSNQVSKILPDTFRKGF